MQKLNLYEYEGEDETSRAEETLDEETEGIVDALQNLGKDENSEGDQISDDQQGYQVLSSLESASNRYQEPTEYITPYDNYGLERSLAIYLREIGRQSLLTKEDEVFLFAQIVPLAAARGVAQQEPFYRLGKTALPGSIASKEDGQLILEHDRVTLAKCTEAVRSDPLNHHLLH